MLPRGPIPELTRQRQGEKRLPADYFSRIELLDVFSNLYDAASRPRGRMGIPSGVAAIAWDQQSPINLRASFTNKAPAGYLTTSPG